MSRDIQFDDEQKRELADTMARVRLEGDTDAWGALRDALVRETTQ